MGGEPTCNHMIPGATAVEIVDNAMNHVEEAHPELAAKIKAMPIEETAKWMADFGTKFETLPEMEARAEEPETPAAA